MYMLLHSMYITWGLWSKHDQLLTSVSGQIRDVRLPELAQSPLSIPSVPCQTRPEPKGLVPEWDGAGCQSAFGRCERKRELPVPATNWRGAGLELERKSCIGGDRTAARIPS